MGPVRLLELSATADTPRSATVRIRVDRSRLLEEVERNVAKVIEDEAEEVERRIRDGENRVEIERPFGLGRIVFEVPSWTRHPCRRFRLELARRQ